MEEDWQNRFKTMRERNKYMLQSGLRADCTFLVGVVENEQEIISAHKFILCGASPFFEKLFFGSLPKKDDELTIIDDIDANDFRDVLEFIYTETMTIRSVESAKCIYNAAEQYQIKELIKQCEKYLIQTLTPINVCKNFEFSVRFQNDNLIVACKKILIQKTSEVLQSDAFYESSFSTFEAILNAPKLSIESELQLFQALEKFARRYLHIKDIEISNGDMTETTSNAKAKPAEFVEDNNNKENSQQSNRIQDFPEIYKLVQKIRFLTMTPHEFVSAPAFSILLSKSDSLSILACLVELGQIKINQNFLSNSYMYRENRGNSMVEPTKINQYYPKNFCTSRENRGNFERYYN